MPDNEQPALERLIDGFWGVDAFMSELRIRIQSELRDGKSPFIRVFITDRKE